MEDDFQEEAGGREGRLPGTLETLVGEGLSGGGRSVAGPRERVLEAISTTIPYSLVVVGDLYAGSPSAARTRLTREFTSFLPAN